MAIPSLITNTDKDTMPSPLDTLTTLLHQAPLGLPLPVVRMMLLTQHSPEGWEPLAVLEKRYSPLEPEHQQFWAEKATSFKGLPYLMAYTSVLQTVLASPNNVGSLQAVLSNEKETPLPHALKDALGLVHKQVDDLYGDAAKLMADDDFQLIWQLPKVALHEHQRGCVPMAMIRAHLLEQDDEKALLGYNALKNACRIERRFTPQGKGPLYTPNLEHYRQQYDVVSKAVHNEATAYMAAYIFTLAMAIERVQYFEYRFNPMTGADPVQYARIIQQGIDDAKAFLWEYTGQRIQANLVFTGYRGNFDLDFAKRFYTEAKTERVQNAMAVLEAAIAAREQGLHVTGFDLAGDEHHFAITDFSPVAQRLKTYNQQVSSLHRIGATIHAGETPFTNALVGEHALRTGAQSVRDTIDTFWHPHTPVRIGHGVHAITDPDLLALCRERHICFEQCPKSNVQTGAVDHYNSLPTLQLLQQGVPVTVSTDNSTISKSNPTNELVKLTRYLNANHLMRQQLQTNGLEAAFMFNTDEKAELQSHMANAFKELNAQVTPMVR